MGGFGVGRGGGGDYGRGARRAGSMVSKGGRSGSVVPSWHKDGTNTMNSCRSNGGG